MTSIFKVLLLGGAKVGKSTFLDSLLGHERQDHIINNPTIRVAVHPLSFNTSKNPVKLMVWDCADGLTGKRDLGGLQEHINGANAVIFMYATDDEESLKNLDSYFDAVARVLGEDELDKTKLAVPAIVVGNKKESGDKKFQSAHHIKLEHFEISVKSKENVWDPIYSLIRQLMREPDLQVTYDPNPQPEPEHPEHSGALSWDTHFPHNAHSEHHDFGPPFSPVPPGGDHNFGPSLYNPVPGPFHVPQGPNNVHPQIAFLEHLVQSLIHRVDQKDREIAAIFDLLEKKFPDFNRQSVPGSVPAYGENYGENFGLVPPGGVIPQPSDFGHNPHFSHFDYGQNLSTDSGLHFPVTNSNKSPRHDSNFEDEEFGSEDEDINTDTVSSPVPVPTKSKKRTVKDPNVPLRPRSAFLWYSKPNREKFKSQYPDLNMIDLTKKIALAWKDLSDEDKKIYQQQEAEDKERYQRELEAYQKKNE